MYGLVVPLFGRSFYPENSLMDRYGNDQRFNLAHHTDIHFGVKAEDTFTRRSDALPLARKAPRKNPFTP